MAAEVGPSSLPAAESTTVVKHSSIQGYFADRLENSGYYFAGGLAGAVSRTATAPFDRLKVYLIAQTRAAPKDVLRAAVNQPTVSAAKAVHPFKQAVTELWKAGGIRSFFAGMLGIMESLVYRTPLMSIGNGLNVFKVLPESAIKFGSFEVCHSGEISSTCRSLRFYRPQNRP